MGIIVHENSQTFHLCNDYISYIIKILPSGQAGQLYYGRRIRDREHFDHLLELAHRDMAPVPFPGIDTTYSLEHIKQEYAGFGFGDMRYPAYEIGRENGSRIGIFRYCGHEIQNGKPPLEGLPAVYVETEDEAQTLKLRFIDEVTRMELVLSYTIFEALPVVTRSVRFKNCGSEKLKLNRAMSLCLDLPDAVYDMTDLTGAWARERSVKTHRIHQGVQSIHSMRGHSSHQFNPFLALKRPETDEFSGEVIGISLIYSGNFLAQAEADTMGTLRILMGIHPDTFCWPMEPDEVFQTPESVLVYSDQGLNRMSQVFHELYRSRLARGYWRDRERPILINNWEATYMQFDEEKILSIAKKAKELGIELFVLDDGWFGERNDDSTSLGDWYANREKLPDGIGGLSKKIEALGMKFGLWFEPEMVSPKSSLYEAHPDWIIGSTDRPLCTGRHQFVLDFSKDEVVRYIGDRMEEILSTGSVSYIKWDMNRSISDLYSSGRDADFQGTLYHRQILGVYSLYERLIKKFPQVLFESCASGGARFDPGMLYYAPQGWVSDDTDAAERIKIQYGTSYVYPLSSIGSHVSAVPNHQTYRNTPLSTRASAAFFGTFGYELDLNLLSEDEQAQVAQQAAFMKRYRKFLHSGDFYRLKSPFEGNEAAWMVVSKDKKLALVAYFRMLQPVNTGFSRILLAGLAPDAEYTISDRAYSCYGDELMHAGLILSDAASGVRTSSVPQGDFLSRLILLENKSANE